MNNKSRVTVKFPYSDKHMYAFADGKWRLVLCDCHESDKRCMAASTFKRGEIPGATTRRISIERYYELCGELATLAALGFITGGAKQ